VNALIILLLLVFNGAFALSEIAVVSSRKARLQQLANEGDARARAALALANEPTRFLSTVQIGMTLVGILSGAIGQAAFSAPLEAQLDRIPVLAPYGHAISLGIVVLIITYLSLVIGELVPKRLALYNPERVASAIAQPMRLVSTITAPAVHLLTVSTEGVLRLLGSRPPAGPPITGDEINVLMAQGAQAGVFEEAEEKIVRSVFRLGDREVRVLMTPRPDIVWLDLNDPPEENTRKLTAGIYSRFPVARDSLDNVLGVIQTKDLLRPCLAGETLDLAACLHPPLFVSETLPALELLQTFKQSRVQIALLVDEYGSVQGLVTLDDVLESIVGEIPSQEQNEEREAIQREDGSWLLGGLLPVDEFKDLFHVQELPGEERGDYQTLGGFVMMQMGRIPLTGDKFTWDVLNFEILDMDGRRVDKVLVTPVSGEPRGETGEGI
jgi:putative hemolysin